MTCNNEKLDLDAEPRAGQDDSDFANSSLVIPMDEDENLTEPPQVRAVKRRRRQQCEEEEELGSEAAGVIDMELDQSLEAKSRQLHLSSVNVRNIIHEVITNEHVVAMMKAAINETEATPPFEPKMTRSKFKEVVESGVVIPAWNLSPIKKSDDTIKQPQFIDIALPDEDSSDDEEYRPDEDEDDETAEDTLLESDMESTASSPRGRNFLRGEEDSCSPWQSSRSRRRLAPVSMGPPPPPKALPPKPMTDSLFLEKLHAVEEELAVCSDPYQPLTESHSDVGLMAYRTRSKRPLRNVPLDQLEAELQAPDITPDMYDSNHAHEDREWTDWLRGLMRSHVDNEDECDDDDDPEYNFLSDIDEPDLEDYRDDKAVRITKKELNELMEELFETLKEDISGQEVDEEEVHTDENAHTSEEHLVVTQCDEEEPIAEVRTVKQQLALMRKRQERNTLSPPVSQEPHTLSLLTSQINTLQQHLQQHVQLLTQVHLLTSSVSQLQSEAQTTRQFLLELDMLARRSEALGLPSVFRSANLQGALQLLEELETEPLPLHSRKHPCDARGHKRCFPTLPAQLAWIFATRPVFMYPEMLPRVSLDPELYCPRRTNAFTASEDCLLVLGLRHMDGSSDPVQFVSQFLLCKSAAQIRRRLLQCCRPGSHDNIVKLFKCQRVVGAMPVACRRVPASECRPPVERDSKLLPMWLQRSVPVIYSFIRLYNADSAATPFTPHSLSQRTLLRSVHSCAFPPGTQYPPRLPAQLRFKRIGFVPVPGPEALCRPDGPMATLPPSGEVVMEEGVDKVDESEEPRVQAAEESSEEEEEEEDDNRHVLSESSLSSAPNSPVEETAGSCDQATPDRTKNLCAKNVTTGSNGERLILWTREDDRIILTSCQRNGATQKTFRQISCKLINKSAHQVKVRFHDLINLFHSTHRQKKAEPD
ncbi:GON-4-like protein isoform X1 [Synchiropus splendidus]|uniref:GON-4-like protein isoform X1 n=1 Tax=Synchiropus splendidus TaxID=270530 RepID=UPI00237DCA58|nr:GON-4-like protein isoform X1 [Synchiropus splendidus]